MRGSSTKTDATQGHLTPRGPGIDHASPQLSPTPKDAASKFFVFARE